MFVALKEAYQTNARGEVRVIAKGATITPAQYRKLSENAQAKFQEVEKKVRVSKAVRLEAAADEILAELLNEAQRDTEATPIDFTQYSNVLVDWKAE